MTRDEIMALSGRELDAAVAEHVMGYRRRIVPKDVDGKHGGTEVLVPASVDHDSFCYPPKGPIPFTFFVPHYSTDIAAAWQVVAMLERRCLEIHISNRVCLTTPTSWTVSFTPVAGAVAFQMTHESIETAICRAASLAHFQHVTDRAVVP